MGSNDSSDTIDWGLINNERIEKKHNCYAVFAVFDVEIKKACTNVFNFKPSNILVKNYQNQFFVFLHLLNPNNPNER